MTGPARPDGLREEVPGGAAGAVADVAMAVAAFGAALRDAGLPVGPGRCERFARAITLMRPSSPAELRACGLATLVSAPDQIEVFDRVFAAMFGGAGGMDGVAGPVGPGGDPGLRTADGAPGAQRTGPVVLDSLAVSQSGEPGPEETAPWHAIASAAERLGSRDFAELSATELSELEALTRKLSLVTPLRRTRRHRPASGGTRADLRETLRQARRTGGEPMMLARTAARLRPRRLVVLCDISGSMEPYARAMLQLLYCVIQGGAGGPGGPGAARDRIAGSDPLGTPRLPRRPGSGGVRGRGPGSAVRTEVFTFATRLTRITEELAAAPPGTVLARAGKAAPDWSGGTRIGDALKEFNDVYGCRGMARGAVVLIISDGWETGDPARVGTEMTRLSRVAYRIVWANPRTKSPRYSPEVGGMAAAWPYCDAVVSAHNLNALGDLIAALGARA